MGNIDELNKIQKVEECHKVLKVSDKIRKIAKWVILGTGAVVVTSGILINNKLEDLREDMLEDVCNKELMTEFNEYLAEKNSDKYDNVDKGFVTETEYLDSLAEEDDYTTKFVAFCSQNDDETIRNRVSEYVAQADVYNDVDKVIKDLSLGFVGAGVVAYFGSKKMKKQAKAELFEMLYGKDEDDAEYDFR